MKRYKKAKTTTAVTPEMLVLGMLYIADVRLVNNAGEKIKHKLLLVGCEKDDIERKMRWLFDSRQYKEISLTAVEKVREKVHFLSTVVTQPDGPMLPVIERDERSEHVVQNRTQIEPYDPILFAVGIATTMLAKDPAHALRKVGHAIVSHATEGASHSGAALSADSTIQIEAIPKTNGYAQPRDVSQETNRAHIVRG